MAKSSIRHLMNTYVNSNSNKYCPLMQLICNPIEGSYWKCRDICKMKLNNYYYKDCVATRLEGMK